MIEDDFCYVDKTALAYKLVKSRRNAFLSRPRRFGKSLLCTTLKYYLYKVGVGFVPANNMERWIIAQGCE